MRGKRVRCDKRDVNKRNQHSEDFAPFDGVMQGARTANTETGVVNMMPQQVHCMMRILARACACNYRSVGEILRSAKVRNIISCGVRNDKYSVSR